MNIQNILATEFNLTAQQVAATVALIDDGNTIPFIARYHKEATDNLNISDYGGNWCGEYYD